MNRIAVHNDSGYRDNRESREPLVKPSKDIKALFASSEIDDEDYFLVPEVLDEP